MLKKLTITEVSLALGRLLQSGSLSLDECLQLRPLVDRICSERFALAARESGGRAYYSDQSFETKADSVQDQSMRLDRWPVKRRATLLIDAVFSIPKFLYNSRALRVLIVGPRNEVEVFHCMSYGVSADNISAVDLISYSDHVAIADAHKLPFENSSFDVVVSGWVLPYSHNYWVMISELIRVLRPGGVAAVGFNCEAYTVPGERLVEQTHTPLLSSYTITDRIGPWLGQVYVRVDPEFPFTQLTQRIHLVFSVKKERSFVPLNMDIESAVRGRVNSLNARPSFSKFADACRRVYGFPRFVSKEHLDDSPDSIISWATTASIGNGLPFQERIALGDLSLVLNSSTPRRVQELMGFCPVLTGLYRFSQANASDFDTVQRYSRELRLSSAEEGYDSCVLCLQYIRDVVYLSIWSPVVPEAPTVRVRGCAVNLDTDHYPRLFAAIDWDYL